MLIGLNEDHIMVQDTARKFAVDQLAPIAADLDQGACKNAFLSNLKSMADLGFMGLNVSSDYGGAECGVIAFSLAITEVARGCAASAVTMSVTNMVAELIQAIGTEEQKREHVTNICSGEYLAASFCLSESGAGSDPAGMKTKAIQHGDHWILNGSKMWISSAEYAGVFVVWAVTDPDRPKGKGITCFLVRADAPGITIGKPERKMGQRGSSTASVSFDDCRVPESAMLGRVNEGYRIATTELAGGRIGIASLALGLGGAAMDVARSYSLERKQFGQAISRFQGIQWMLADHYTELEAARLLVLNAAYQKEEGRPFAKEASMAKLYASEAANRACYSALQIMGGVGYTEELPLERYARDVRVTSIYEGTSEIQRMIIARELLREVA
ncbi:acyl-CoA dehydrogenase family protein [Hyphomonas sp.]|uniref:acyl-CoA dehydrogenase family protein n=1 Tax=Hyphomonas sp. TaxID=87 RepID=UPI003D2AEC09